MHNKPRVGSEDILQKYFGTILTNESISISYIINTIKIHMLTIMYILLIHSQINTKNKALLSQLYMDDVGL